MEHAGKVAVPVYASARPSAGLSEDLDRQQDAPRKLIGPRLPGSAGRQLLAPRRLRGMAPLVAHEPATPNGHHSRSATSHAEAFYLQKQMQAQTPMVFVLEDGAEVQGVVEWFDRDSIKVRNHTRTLLFKRGIKYLYKAGGEHSL